MTRPLRTPCAARIFLVAPLAALSTLVCACAQPAPTDRARVSGQIEATDVQVASQVGGRLLELRVAEGDRVNAGDVVGRLDTADAAIALDGGSG